MGARRGTRRILRQIRTGDYRSFTDGGVLIPPAPRRARSKLYPDFPGS